VPVKYRVEITRIAETDIAEIWAHIAADSIENATRFVSRLENKLDTLERLPHRCPAIPENGLLRTNYRHLVLGDYRMIFRVSQSTVIVLRVMHGNRLLESAFLEND